MERGAVSSPHAATLHRLAQALDVPVAHLACSEPSVPPRTELKAGLDPVEFDRRTNPYVDVVRQQFPELFTGFTADDWEELYSSFGTGGALTEEGVRHAAALIARKRETLRRLSVVLETHLGAAAMAMVDSLYQLIAVVEEPTIADHVGNK
jgi:transcriptional regulator with XRE-family HTH domain